MSSRPNSQPERQRISRKSVDKPEKLDASAPKPIAKTDGSPRGKGLKSEASVPKLKPNLDAAPLNGDPNVGSPAPPPVSVSGALDHKRLQWFHRLKNYFGSTISRVERWLVVVSGGYFLAFATFFAYVWSGHEYPAWRLTFTLVSVILDLVIVIATQNKTLRIVLVALPSLALALLHSESESQLYKISKQQISVNLMRDHERDLQDKERHIAEDVLIDVGNTVRMSESVHLGFQIKSRRLQMSVAEMEASLLAQHPEMLQLVFGFPDDPAAKLKSYEKLEKGNPRLEMPIEEVLQPLRNEVAYGDLADFFRRQINPQYLQLKSVLNHNPYSSGICQRIFKILDTLAQMQLNYPVAGLLNHMGTVAMSCGRRYQALGNFYTALALDPMHLPAYESLAYLLWLGNKDERTALEIVEHGLRLCASERRGLEESFRRTIESYDLIGRNAPAHALLLRRRTEKLKKRMAKLQAPWDQFMDEMEKRLRNDFAYFSALGRRNEQKARIYILELYQADPKCANYQDTYGFVKMRFARDEEELEEAGQLFTAAIENLAAGKEEVRLASAHKDEIDRYKSELQGRQDSGIR